ncbi:hypothetical protein DERP_013019 [Dermatophagoides pteronyssinus]|uniref:Uncharacterized protein n=1 Tax=Dermatophagoides pteronyssinus TaxID=6956 RepID=A0ABQ8JPR4_DERPT|nr:hypothetical protein DERP_013019 [Dermatophagoides pteronyssinus]
MDNNNDDEMIVQTIEGTQQLIDLHEKFKQEILLRSERLRSEKPSFSFPKRKIKLKAHKHHHAKRSGIRHGIYLGEEHLPRCNPNTNNRHRLYHYQVSINPKINFLVDAATTIKHDDHIYYFEGYSLFSHFPIPNSFPSCKIIRYNIGYEITFVEDDFPQNFCVGDLDLMFDYIFYELLELVDLNVKAKDDNDGCNRFHFMPRFVRLIENNGKELLSMSIVLEYLYRKSKPLIDESKLEKLSQMTIKEWNQFAMKHKGYLVTCPSMKPCSIRVDQIDREKDDIIVDDDKNQSDCQNNDKYPVIVHFGIRPPQLSYAGNPKYQKAWRDYVKYRHLLANKEKVSYDDKEILMQKEEKLQEMRSKSDLKRDVTVVISSKGFYCTGLQCDIVQHSLIIPVLISHLRFHYSLQHLEKIIKYTFNDRSLLQLSLTHPSYRENFGTNPDHARNTLTNCGLRYLEYGDRKVHFMNTRKRGINMLINIMSRFGCNEETVSNINHNERLEFLGDAVVEFLTSIHLYFLFPDLEEGGLATYRAALVQNQHLAILARKLQLEKFMLYAHGSDLCHDLELRHAMANCFEAFMGALFLDGGINVADHVFSSTLFDDNDEQSKLLHRIWSDYPKHPIQQQYPNGDRHLIDKVNRLSELAKFEQMTGIEFNHIRLLARAFTHRSVGYNNLTLGSNQRMEFLGDTVLQLIASEYLYKYFPDHHEGHLSLLRSSLVNNKTQSVVCDDLGIVDMTQYNSIKSELKTKDRADLLEAFIGALYVDKGIDYCRRFCEVCFFPRLEHFIMNQDWNDPKSKLQQCCLTLRSADCGEPDIPTYKVIDSKGPTNTRIYEVAVYFRDDRLATGKGHSIQEAEMNAATNALRLSKAKQQPEPTILSNELEQQQQQQQIPPSLSTTTAKLLQKYYQKLLPPYNIDDDDNNDVFKYKNSNNRPAAVLRREFHQQPKQQQQQPFIDDDLNRLLDDDDNVNLKNFENFNRKWKLMKHPSISTNYRQPSSPLVFSEENMAIPYDEIEQTKKRKSNDDDVTAAKINSVNHDNHQQHQQKSLIQPEKRLQVGSSSLKQQQPSNIMNSKHSIQIPKSYQLSMLMNNNNDGKSSMESKFSSLSDIYFIAIVACISTVAIFSVIGAGYCFYKVQQSNKAAADVDFPAYGVIGPVSRSGGGGIGGGGTLGGDNNDGKCQSPNNDRKLVQSAQIYHYHHQKQQMISTEKNSNVPKNNTMGSDIESDEENEDGEYTVYECPGLAPTGEMEIKNPLFQDDLTPMSSPSVNNGTSSSSSATSKQTTPKDLNDSTKQSIINNNHNNNKNRKLIKKRKNNTSD